MARLKTFERQHRTLEEQLDKTKAQLDKARSEHEDYRVKAAKVLADKERLIASLKENRDQGEEALELQQAVQERDLLREEVVKVCSELGAARQEAAESERQLIDQEQLATQRQSKAAEVVAETREKWRQTQQRLSDTEKVSLKQNISYLFTRQRKSFTRYLHSGEFISN